MLKNYLKIFIRNLKRNKTYSVINILGLSTGIASSILILLWISNELSYDRLHKNADVIYRVVAEDGVVGKMSVTCGPLAEYMKTTYPDVVSTTRYMPYEGSAFKYQDKILRIEKGAFADPDFFKMFSFSFLRGNPETALKDLTDIVITESTAKKFFGNKNPVGRVLLVDGKDPLTVSAVIKNIPANSQLRFDYIINTQILKYIGFPFDDWSNAGLNTFIQVKKGTDTQKLNKQIADIMSKQVPGFNRKLFLQPLTDIHLNTDFAYDLPGIGDKKYIYIFSAIALFLVLIACINYINLSTARILKRSKEVGLRKIMGSNRLQIVKQFFGESAIIVLFSFMIAYALIEILLPLFNRISGETLTANFIDLTFFGIAAVLLIFVSLLSGGYPSLFLSSVKPVNALKNVFSDNRKGSSFRKILVVIQFSLSIILIVGTATVFYQLNYIKNKKLGFDKENILTFNAKGKFQQDYNTMKNELLNQSSILNVTAEDRLLTNSKQSTTNISWEGNDGESGINMGYSYVDYNYFDMMEVKMKEGRNFSKDMNTDRDAFILNEEAVNEMKLNNPIGRRFALNNKQGRIIGVIKNTNFRSLHYKVQPTAYMILNNYSELSFKYNGIIYVKTAAGKTRDAIAAIEKIWKKENPDIPFEFHFLDKTIDNQYVKEVQTGEIFGYFSLIAIFISCLGLYGLTLFTIENRTKEIGIRKVLGASVINVLEIFFKDYLKLILLSTVIACPIALYAMNKWLESFAYKISVSWWLFALAGGIALLITLITVSFQAIKAAAANPVESLRYE